MSTRHVSEHVALDSGDVLRGLRSVLAGERPRIAVLHCSLLALPASSGDALKWSMLRAFEGLNDLGWTIAVPTFTFAYCRSSAYHHVQSVPETGSVGRWLLERASVRRTPHPIYSFAVVGPEAESILRRTSSTTFGADSPFGLFLETDAQLVMVGAPWSTCTQLHFFEEEAKVPYRQYKDFAGTADFGSGQRSCAARMFVRDETIAAENDFTPAIERLRRNGGIRTARAGRLTVEAAGARDLAIAARSCLAETPFAFVRKPLVVERQARDQQRRLKAPPLRVALLASYNTDLLKDALLAQMRAHVPDRAIEIYTAGFGRATAEASAADSALWRWRPDYVVFADRLEDAVRVESLHDVASDWPDTLSTHVGAVAAAAARCPGKVFALEFGALRSTAVGDANPPWSPRRLAEAANRLLAEVAGLHVLFMPEGLAASGTFDDRLWCLARAPWSQAATAALAERITGGLLAALGRTVRLLVLDLDNTVWGGVLGDDGVHGLQLGPDHPGNCFRMMQRTLKALARRGIALAVVSKNDEANAVAAINSHPEMLLRESDLVTYRIDWQPKWRHVADIAEELGLGLQSIGFVDDSPAERAEMQLNLPDVQVLDLPRDPALFSGALLNWPYLACIEQTAEDRGRVQAYGARRRVEQARKSFADPRDFFASLGARVHLAPLQAESMGRAAQLMMKTNQYNTTTRRYGQIDLEAQRNAGRQILVIGYEDKFSPTENIGVVICGAPSPSSDRVDIDSLLLSCRVLGRGIETAVLSHVAYGAKERGQRWLWGQIIETERNTPVRSLYRDHGFVDAGDGWWKLDLHGSLPRVPEGVTLVVHSVERVDA